MFRGRNKFIHMDDCSSHSNCTRSVSKKKAYSLANTALLSLARPNNPPSTSQRDSTDGQANWLEVNLKRPAKQAPQRPRNDTQPRVLRNHWIIIRGLSEIRADRAAFETRKTFCCRQSRGSTW